MITFPLGRARPCVARLRMSQVTPLPRHGATAGYIPSFCTTLAARPWAQPLPGRRPNWSWPLSAGPRGAPPLNSGEMADYVRLCEIGENLEHAAARSAREQAARDLSVRQRHAGIVLGAVVIGTAITLLCLIV